MTDLAIDLFEDGADLALAAGDLATAPGLAEAVLVSLFSDARATDDEQLAEATSDPRGWWGEDPPDRMGSKLWLLARAKDSAETAERIRDTCLEALAWMRELDVAESVDCAVTRLGQGIVDVAIAIHRGNARRYSELWRGIETGEQAVSSLGDSRLRLLFT